MTAAEVTEYIGLLVGSFSMGYVAGFLLLAFKRSAGFVGK